jgi:glycerate 2-kinase
VYLYGQVGSDYLSMKILVVPDSFKECLDAFSVAEAIASGLRRGALQPLQVESCPLADGGEGLMWVLLHALGGKSFDKTVSGPMGHPVRASLGLLEDGKTAVIEMASAAGLHLVEKERRNPLLASTRGVGELMRYAIDLGASRIIVGLGGSATNDGGAGMAQALGVSLLDAMGRELPPGGEILSKLDRIDMSSMDKRIMDVEVIGACDVTSPLCGPQGASCIYGLQKGASDDDIQRLDEALHHFGCVIEKQLGKEVLSLPGGGAAGGLGAGLAAFAVARLRSGVRLVLESYCDMEQRVKSADILFSGEGSVDGQTVHGKVVAGVAALAKKHHKPLIVLTGRIQGDLSALYDAGVTGVFPIAPKPMEQSEAVAHAKAYLTQTAENLMRTIASITEGSRRA